MRKAAHEQIEPIGEEPYFAAFMPATGEICGVGRSEDSAVAAAKASEHSSLKGISDQIEYEVWPCSALLYATVEAEGGDIGYDHWKKTLVTEQEAAQLAAASTSAP